MADYTRVHDFEAGETIQDTEMDAEFNAVATAVATKPEADGTVQPTLNADLLDGFHANVLGGTDTIPVCNGSIQVALNAQMLGGLLAADLAESGFPEDTVMVFYQSSAPDGWTATSRPGLDRVLGLSSSDSLGGTENTAGGGGADWGRDDFVVTIGEHATTLAESAVQAVSGVSAFAGLGEVGSGASGGEAPALLYFTDYTASYSSIALTNGVTNGGGQTHNHTTGSSAATPHTYRPPIRWCILASKDAPV